MSDANCYFEYPSRWQQLYEAFLSDDEEMLQQAIAQLEERDIALEDHLRNRPCGGECDCQAICAFVSGASGDLDESNTFASLIQTEVSTDRNDWSQNEYRYGDWSWNGSTHKNGTDPGAWLVGCDLYYDGSTVGTDTVKVGVSMIGGGADVLSIAALDGNGLLLRSSGFYTVRDFAQFELAASVRLVAPGSHDRVFAGAWWSGWLWAVKVCGCGPGSFPVG